MKSVWALRVAGSLLAIPALLHLLNPSERMDMASFEIDQLDALLLSPQSVDIPTGTKKATSESVASDVAGRNENEPRDAKALSFSEEPINPIWASQTSARIYGEIAQLVGTPNLMQVTYRSTRCEIVLAYAGRTEERYLRTAYIDDALKASLNLSRCSTSSNGQAETSVVTMLLRQGDAPCVTGWPPVDAD